MYMYIYRCMYLSCVFACGVYVCMCMYVYNIYIYVPLLVS